MNKNASQFVVVFSSSLLLWLLLVGGLNKDELIAGVVISVLAALFASGKTSIFSAVKFTPTMPVALSMYLLTFFKELLLANIDLARRVVLPVIPIKPSIVTVKTELKSDLGKLLLANSITLTPGTLSVDINDDEIMVHWIDSPKDSNIETVTKTIAGDLEKWIKGFLK